MSNQYGHIAFLSRSARLCGNFLALSVRLFLIIMTLSGNVLLSQGVFADDLAPLDPFQRYQIDGASVIAVQTTFQVEPGNKVRVIFYDREDDFLSAPIMKLESSFDDTGLALLPLQLASAKDYAFAVYYDENQDGKLNRNILGKPKEPYIFSNNFKPKLRKPSFDETKLLLEPGKVVVVTLHD